MKKNELKEEQLLSKLIIDATNSHLIELIKEPKVQEYITETEILTKELARQKYINNLEIGEDNTIFSKEREVETKRYSLENILQHAITLKYLEFVNDFGIVSPESIINIEINYEDLKNYIKNARNILNQMNHKKGDQRIENIYNLLVYSNPKNNIISPQMEINLLKLHNLITTLHITKEDSPVLLQKEKLKIKTFAYKLPLAHYTELTEREKESFYGANAKHLLNIKQFDIEKKDIEPTTKKK